MTSDKSAAEEQHECERCGATGTPLYTTADEPCVRVTVPPGEDTGAPICGDCWTDLLVIIRKDAEPHERS